MDFSTKVTKTKVVTNTKLAIATIALLAAGGAAMAAVSSDLTARTVKVRLCQSRESGIHVVTTNGVKKDFVNGCVERGRNAGKFFTYVCLTPKKYRVYTSSCAGSEPYGYPTPSPYPNPEPYPYPSPEPYVYPYPDPYYNPVPDPYTYTTPGTYSVPGGQSDSGTGSRAIKIPGR